MSVNGSENDSMDAHDLEALLEEVRYCTLGKKQVWLPH